jgi:hypothetical protein
MQHTDEPSEIRQYFLDCIINDKINDAKLYVNEYVEKYQDNEMAMGRLTRALAGLPQEHGSEINFERKDEIRRYLLSVMCISGNKNAIHELGFLYEGLDGDEMDHMHIPQTNITTALTLYNLANNYRSCLEIIYICTKGNEINHYFDAMYPKKCIDAMIKTNLIKALKLYDKPIDNPDYCEDIGYIFSCIPSELIEEVKTEHPEISKYMLKVK